MMHILLVDDEPLALSRLQRLLADSPGCTVVGEAANGRQALQQYAALKPDLLLLDIHMPEMSGIDVAAQLKQQQPSPAIIFCTAFEEHALEAFEEQAIDYLLKPVRRERLQEALTKARKYLGLENGGIPRKYIRSRLGEKVFLIPLEDIFCARAEDKYTTIVYRGGEAIIDESLKALEEDFADDFLRIHRNTLVAKDKIRGFKRVAGGQQELLLDGTDFSPQISRRKGAMIRDWLKQQT